MIQIKSLPQSQLRNSEHYQFMSDMKQQIVQLTPTALGLESVYSVFEFALGIEDVCLRIEKGSSKSLNLNELDTRRDTTWTALQAMLKAYSFSPFPAEVESSRKLTRIFDLYGNIRRQSYNEESASITNLIAELKKEPQLAEVESLSLISWIDVLKSTNDDFINLFNERNAELADREDGDSREARIKTDEAYDTIVSRINAAFVLEIASAEAETFVSQLNEKIDYYRNSLAIRHGHSNN